MTTLRKHKSFALALALVLALALLWPAQAQAYPMACRYIAHGQVCRSSVDGMRTARCDRGYQLMPNWTCAPLGAP